jgi:acetyl esterase/lipase
MLTKPSLVSFPTLFGLIFLPNLQAQKPPGKTPPLPEGVQAVRDLEYAVRDSISLKLDLYLPREEVKFPLPVVVWIHGGGWLNGSKDKCPGVYLAARGFAVASISYRLTDTATWPSQIDDCYEAVRWLRGEAAKTYSLDPDHIGVWGGSAGGHLAALVGTRPAGEEAVSSRVQAVCDWYGPSDLLTMPPNLVSETRTAEQVAQSNGAKLLGATVREVPDLAKDASALYQVSGDDPPFLIMHGSADPGVPIDQSQRLHDALVRAGVESEFVVVEGAGHGGKEFQTEAVKEKVATFFEKTLRP